MNNLIISYTIILLLFLIFFIMNRKETFDVPSADINYSIEDATMFLKKCIPGKKGVKGEPGEDRHIDVPNIYKLYTDLFDTLFESKEKTINYQPNNCLRDHGSQEVARGGSGGRGTDHMCPPNATICNIEPGNSKGVCSNYRANRESRRQEEDNEDGPGEDLVETENPHNTDKPLTTNSNQTNQEFLNEKGCRFDYDEERGVDMNGNTIKVKDYPDNGPLSMCTEEKPFCRGYDKDKEEFGEFGKCVSEEHIDNLKENGCKANFGGKINDPYNSGYIEEENDRCPKHIPICLGYKPKEGGDGRRGDCTTQENIKEMKDNGCRQDYREEERYKSNSKEMKKDCTSKHFNICSSASVCVSQQQKDNNWGGVYNVKNVPGCKFDFNEHGLDVKEIRESGTTQTRTQKEDQMCPAYMPKCYQYNEGRPGGCVKQRDYENLIKDGCGRDDECPYTAPHCIHKIGGKNGTCVNDDRKDMLNETREGPGVGACAYDFRDDHERRISKRYNEYYRRGGGAGTNWEQRIECPRSFPICLGFRKHHFGTCVTRKHLQCGGQVGGDKHPGLIGRGCGQGAPADRYR